MAKAKELKFPAGAVRKAIPTKVEPMLATLVDSPFSDKNWLFEVKWDGYRCIAILNGKNVELLSRNSKSFNDKYYPVFDELTSWNKKMILDGEIIVADQNGKSDFGSLQNWRSETDGTLLFYVFDILWIDGYNLENIPLIERKKILTDVLPQSDIVLISDFIEEEGEAFFKSADNIGLEGIIAKRKDSVYNEGNRSKDWLKIKTELRQEVVIGGYTVNDGTSKPFSALLAGVYKNGELLYTGKIGTGFNVKEQKELLKRFKPLQINKIPFGHTPDYNSPSRFRPNPPHAEAFWLKPELICEVSYRELTKDGIMRHPSFKGMREDKNAKDVVLEKKTKTEKVMPKSKKDQPIVTAKKGKDVTTFLNPKEKTQVKKIGGHDIQFTNLDKVFWPAEKFTKRDLLNYYFLMSPYILPYLKNRPQSLNRFPNGITGKSFYQKDVTGKVPDWIEKQPYVTEGEDKNFMLCNNLATLLYIANLGAIEMNPWSSTIKKPDNPDFCIIDLDPDKNTFNQVVETACVVYDILSSAKIDCYCKTSGSTGIHIYIPLGAKYTYEESKEFGRLIATMVNEELPDITSIERQISKRDGKLYVDFLQNRPQATVACAYSVRPKPGATVSMPLHWEEVKKGLKMRHLNIKNAYERVKETGDIFKGVLGKGIDMKKALLNLNRM